MCFISFLHQTRTVSLHIIYRLTLLMVTGSVRCAVRTEFLCMSQKRRSFTRAVSHWCVAAEKGVRSQASLCDTYGGQTVSGTGFTTRTWVRP
jgi:hypothetical protein